MKKEDLSSELLARASTAYTAGPLRQTIQLTAWLLETWRSEAEFLARLRYVFDELTPEQKKALIVELRK